MPIVQTWIRKEDYSKYIQLSSTRGAWSEFIHNALNPTSLTIHSSEGPETVTVLKTDGLTVLDEFAKNPDKKLVDEHTKTLKELNLADDLEVIPGTAFSVIKSPKDAEKAIKHSIIEDFAGDGKTARKLCKIHLTPLDDRGKCLQKGCKYA